MPVGIQRLNAKRSQPNSRIVFIKPLKGPDEAIAQDFLERIAAQCLPVMKEHTLSVMSLEEYEPNREFVGRNFNAGEVIQLVLKSPSTGRWLPFNYVQMVMMHELAHCKQMNHSRAFWKVRNAYAEQMRGLWGLEYTGEGLWGRGALLATGDWARDPARPDETLAGEHLCGGTYRSRRRGRKRKQQQQQQLSYQERKQRRILNKFGAGGVALGDDEAVKARLEKGRPATKAKPRVAGSMRGRELRAAAALARFDQKKVEDEEAEFEDKVKAEGCGDGDDDDDERDGDSDATASEDEGDAELDVNGRRLTDDKGHRLIKVCEDESLEGEGGDDARNEMNELFQSSFPAVATGISSNRQRSHKGLTNSSAAAAGSSKSRSAKAGDGARGSGRAAVKKEAADASVVKIEIEDEEEDAGRALHNVPLKQEPASPPPPPPPTAQQRRAEEEKAKASEKPKITIHRLKDSRPPPLPPQVQRRTAPPQPAVHPGASSSSSSPSSSSSSSAGRQDAAAGDKKNPAPARQLAAVPPSPPPRCCPLCSFDSGPGAAVCAMCAHVLDAGRVPGGAWSCAAAAPCRASAYLNAADAGACGLCGGTRSEATSETVFG